MHACSHGRAVLELSGIWCLRVAADVAESIGRELLVYGRRVPKAEMFARIDAVDAATIRAVADRFIYDQVRPALRNRSCKGLRERAAHLQGQDDMVAVSNSNVACLAGLWINSKRDAWGQCSGMHTHTC